MEDYYKVHNICRIIYAEEEHPFIEVTTDTDFQYYIYVNQQITVVTKSAQYKGKISVVQENYFEITSEDGKEVNIIYSEVIGIIGDPDIR